MRVEFFLTHIKNVNTLTKTKFNEQEDNTYKFNASKI